MWQHIKQNGKGKRDIYCFVNGKTDLKQKRNLKNIIPIKKL